MVSHAHGQGYADFTFLIPENYGYNGFLEKALIMPTLVIFQPPAYVPFGNKGMFAQQPIKS